MLFSYVCPQVKLASEAVDIRFQARKLRRRRVGVEVTFFGPRVRHMAFRGLVRPSSHPFHASGGLSKELLDLEHRLRSGAVKLGASFRLPVPLAREVAAEKGREDSGAGGQARAMHGAQVTKP